MISNPGDPHPITPGEAVGGDATHVAEALDNGAGSRSLVGQSSRTPDEPGRRCRAPSLALTPAKRSAKSHGVSL